MHFTRSRVQITALHLACLLPLTASSSVAATTAVVPFVNATGMDAFAPLSYGIPDLRSAVTDELTCVCLWGDRERIVLHPAELFTQMLEMD